MSAPPRDPVTARYNEGFHRFYPRVLRQSLVSAFRAERDMLARRGLPWTHQSNPFWRYWGLQGAMLALALALGGLGGLLCFLVQAGVAIWQLELVNYVEHYGLTRRHLGGGRYEHVLPRHSWNASADARRTGCSSTSSAIPITTTSPTAGFRCCRPTPRTRRRSLPYGYPLMTMAAMVPPLWRRVMNPRVRRMAREILSRHHRLEALQRRAQPAATLVVQPPREARRSATQPGDNPRGAQYKARETALCNREDTS